MTAVVLAVLLGQYTEAEARALFTEANQAYAQGDLAGAQARYEKLLRAEAGGPDVLYNLGTTHLAKNELGPAVLYLERARRLAPAEDIEANLALARARQVDQVVGEDTAVPFTRRLADALDEPVVAVGFLALWWAAFMALWARSRVRRKALLTLVAVLLFGGSAVLGGALAIYTSVRSRVVEAVVLAPTARVLEFPQASARTSFEVHAGLIVQVLEQSGDFVHIRLPNALEGWTEKSAVIEL